MKKDTTNTPFIVAFLYKITSETKQIAPRVIAHYIVISMCVALSFYIISLVSPAIGEAWAYNATVFAGILTAGMLGLIAIFGYTVAAWLSGLISAVTIRQISQEIQAAKVRNGPAALPVGDTLRLGADIVLIQWPDEKDSDFANRIEQAKENIKPGSIIACLKWRWGYIPTYSMKDSECKNINREAFDNTTDIEYSIETESDFSRYVNVFQGAFMAFSADLKTSDEKVSPFSTFEKVVRASANVVLFMLLSVAAYGQNTAKIHNALGDNDRVPMSGNSVVYTFTAGQSATRTADGVKKLSELYAAGRVNLESANVGEVEGVAINGTAIGLQKVTIAATGTPGKPAPLFADAGGSAIPVSAKIIIPDSATTARTIQEVDRLARENAADAERWSLQWMASKTWDYGFYFCAWLFLTFRLVSNSAMNESRIGLFGDAVYGGWIYSIGRVFTALAWCVGIFGGVLLFSMMSYNFVNDGFLAMFGVLICKKSGAVLMLLLVAFGIERALDYAIKNPKEKSNDRGGGNAYPQRPGLNSGR
jgi:hypothetical protein